MRYRRRHLAVEDLQMIYRVAAARMRDCQRELAACYVALGHDDTPGTIRCCVENLAMIGALAGVFPVLPAAAQAANQQVADHSVPWFWFAVPAVAIWIAISLRGSRDTRSSLRSYFEDPWLLRLFRACKDQDVEAAYESWVVTKLKQIALNALNVDESDLTRQIDYVWGTLITPMTIEIKDSKGKVVRGCLETRPA